jgi:hypothetical protein
VESNGAATPDRVRVRRLLSVVSIPQTIGSVVPRFSKTRNVAGNALMRIKIAEMQKNNLKNAMRSLAARNKSR